MFELFPLLDPSLLACFINISVKVKDILTKEAKKSS